MANEDVLGPRQTLFILVIVVGCFAVLWPRILSPLLVGPSQEQLKPNKFDRDAGCCEVIFETDMAALQLMNEICSSVTHAEKLSPYSVAECRKAVNATCGVDIAAFLKRTDNFGKSSKLLVETMKNSNSSCLKEHFGVPIWNLGPHIIQNSWTQLDTVKQERPSAMRGVGTHPALREKGRAIPAGDPSPPAKAQRTVTMPPHVRVRSSPLSVYFDLDIKPPPIPGMRPPLGSPGGPVPAPKSSMGFVMPIYTICIIVFFVYTLSKILFKRTGTTPYESLPSDPQFRRRVFRDDSRTSPDKLVVTAISGLVAEVQQQMEASYAQNQQRQDVQQDNHTRPYTNGTILHSTGPVHIVATEYREQSKEKSPEPQTEKEVPLEPKTTAEPEKAEHEVTKVEKEDKAEESIESVAETIDEKKQCSDIKKLTPELEELVKESTPEIDTDIKELPSELEREVKEPTPELQRDVKELTSQYKKQENTTELEDEEVEEEEEEVEVEDEYIEELEPSNSELIKPASDVKVQKNDDTIKTSEFLKEETNALISETEEKQSTPELLEEAIRDDDDLDENEKSSVKVIGMEVTAHVADGSACRAALSASSLSHAPSPTPRAHEAESVQSIYLETDIPQQSRVLVAEFAEDLSDKPQPTRHSPMVVSGKMTLSLIQDSPRETPERDQESTVDDFTTASAITQNAAEKEGEDSEEEIEEEIEIEEIEEEVEEEEEEEVEVPEKILEGQIKKTE